MKGKNRGGDKRGSGAGGKSNKSKDTTKQATSVSNTNKSNAAAASGAGSSSTRNKTSKTKTLNPTPPAPSAAASSPLNQPGSVPASASSPPISTPPPDPLFVLRGTSSAITSLQFISPALRLNELTQLHSELLSSSYSNLNNSSTQGQNTNLKNNTRASLLKTPPPGFLAPTTFIAAGTQNGRIVIWDLKTKESVLSWAAHVHNASVISIKSMSPCDLVSIGRSDSVKLWKLDLEPQNKNSSEDSSNAGLSPCKSELTKRETHVSEGGASATCIASIKIAEYAGFSGCDVFRLYNCLCTAIPGPTQDAVSVWKLNGEVRITELRVNETGKVGSVMHLRWVEKKGKATLLVAYESGDLCLWDWSNRNLFSVATVKDNPVCLEYDQNLSSGIIGTVSEKLYIFSISNTLQLSVTKEISITNEGIGSCVTRPDSKIYVTGGWDHRIRVYSWSKHKPLAVLNYHQGTIAALHYAPSRVTCVEGATSDGAGSYDGTEHLLAAGSTDSTVSLWKIY